MNIKVSTLRGNNQYCSLAAVTDHRAPVVRTYLQEIWGTLTLKGEAYLTSEERTAKLTFNNLQDIEKFMLDLQLLHIKMQKAEMERKALRPKRRAAA